MKTNHQSFIWSLTKWQQIISHQSHQWQIDNQSSATNLITDIWTANPLLLISPLIDEQWIYCHQSDHWQMNSQATVTNLITNRWTANPLPPIWSLINELSIYCHQSYHWQMNSQATITNLITVLLWYTCYNQFCYWMFQCWKGSHLRSLLYTNFSLSLIYIFTQIFQNTCWICKGNWSSFDFTHFKQNLCV